MLVGETRSQARNAWLAIAAIILGVVGAGFAFNEWNKTRYSPAKANIIAITESCRVDALREESGRSRTETVEMPCAAARRRYSALRYGFSEYRTIRYSFTSPVDGQAYTGFFHRYPHQVRDFQVGQEIEILAHKTEPALSRQP